MKNNTLILTLSCITCGQAMVGFYMIMHTDLHKFQTVQLADKTLFQDIAVYSLMSGVGGGWILFTILKESSKKILATIIFLLIFVATWITLIMKHTMIIIAITYDAFAFVHITEGLSASITLLLCPTIKDAIIKDESTILDKE